MEQQLQLLTGAYALNALPDGERADFERFATTDPQTQTELRELSETASLLALGVPAETPPPELKASIMAAVKNTRQLPPVSAVTDLASAREAKAEQVRRRSVLPRMAAAAAVVLIAAAAFGGWAVGNRSSENNQASELSQLRDQQNQQNQMLSIMAATDAKVASQKTSNGGLVTLISSSTMNQAAVMAQDLPPLAADKSYQLWFISADGAIPAGLMKGSSTSKSSVTVLDGAIGKASNVGITIEPAGGSKAPTTTPILVHSL